MRVGLPTVWQFLCCPLVIDDAKFVEEHRVQFKLLYNFGGFFCSPEYDLLCYMF